MRAGGSLAWGCRPGGGPMGGNEGAIVIGVSLVL